MVAWAHLDSSWGELIELGISWMLPLAVRQFDKLGMGYRDYRTPYRPNCFFVKTKLYYVILHSYRRNVKNH